VDRATYTLPNKHYIPVDMKYIGIDNTSPFQSLASVLGKRQYANVIMIQGRSGGVRAGFGSKVRTRQKKGNDESGDITFFSRFVLAA